MSKPRVAGELAIRVLLAFFSHMKYSSILHRYMSMNEEALNCLFCLHIEPEEMRRFHRIYDVVEHVEDYCQGGYHPVHLGDVFNERYEVLGKLSYGQFSTVWLAFDQKQQQRVAIKVLKAKASQQQGEERDILLHLSRPEIQYIGKKNVLELVDYFEHQGPNGTHMYLVFPVMLYDAQTLSRGYAHKQSWLKTVSYQIILGLEYIHASGLIHCDLQPANILFTNTCTSFSLSEPQFSSVKWLEGVAVDNSAPEHLIPSQRIRPTPNLLNSSTTEVKIGDFGAATWSDSPRKQEPVTPRALRAPEVIQRKAWDASIDIWCLGCSIFQLATSEPLFPVGGFGMTAEQFDEEHQSLISHTTDNLGDFMDHLSQRLSPEFPPEDVQTFGSFLWCMPQNDPQKRQPATDLLRHPWLQNSSYHDR